MATTKINNLSSNNLMIVMLLISLLVVGITVLASKSLMTTIARDNKVAQKKSAAEAALKTDLANAPSLVSDTAALGLNKTVLADALPDSVDFPSLLVTLENMANSTSLKLKNVTPVVVGTAVLLKSPTGPGTTPVPKPYQFAISTTGTYDSMLRMIHAIETSARPMRIVDARFDGSGSALNSEFTIETYSQAQAELPFSTETVK